MSQLKPMFLVEVIYRYTEGRDHLAIHTIRVRSKDNESAEKWAIESLKRKMYFEDSEFEIIKTNSICEV